MKRVNFDVSEEMHRQIDIATVRGGFGSYSEFLRFLIITYCKENKITISNEGGELKAEQDKDEEVDLEFGIPLHIIKEIEEEVRLKMQNRQQPQS